MAPIIVDRSLQKSEKRDLDFPNVPTGVKGVFIQLEGRHSDDVSEKVALLPHLLEHATIQYENFQGLVSSLWRSAAVRPCLTMRKIAIHNITQVFLSLIWDLGFIQSSDNFCKPRSGSRANLLCDPEAYLTFYVSTSYAREYNR